MGRRTHCPGVDAVKVGRRMCCLVLYDGGGGSGKKARGGDVVSQPALGFAAMSTSEAGVLSVN